MASKKPADLSVESGMGGFQKLGLGIALSFYVVAVVWVYFVSGAGVIFDPDVKVLTLAHWQLEDGFREGIDKALRQFEQIKADQGEKVIVTQMPIPFRGYAQWMRTQLVGGNPADLLEITGSSDLQYQYFHSLSQYLGKPNPFNKDTPLEGIPWKDTYVDGMAGSLNETYADYFGIGMAFLITRLHANVDLVEKATGSRKMPTDLTEWIEICRKIKEYGEKRGERISPIGVRGIDKGTLNRLYRQYYSETNGHLNDSLSRYCDGKVVSADIIRGMREGTVDLRRQGVAADIVVELGQHFMDGFAAVDLEQVKYLFSRGQVGFFPEGTWNSLSLIQHSSFEVAVVRVPPIGYKHKYSKYFTGKLTESGERSCVRFGIPKKCRHFDLALEVLHFLSSYEINQMVTNEAKWCPAVKFAKSEGIVEKFKPDMEGNMRVDGQPFAAGSKTDSLRNMNQYLEKMIDSNPENPGELFIKNFRKNKSLMIKDQEAAVETAERANVKREMQRSQLSVGLLRKNLTPTERERLELRKTIAAESLTEVVSRSFINRLFLEELKGF